MVIAHHPEAQTSDDYQSVRRNGMWYQSWQSGYHDILKRGFPPPADERAILAEIYSPNVPDFLHGGSGDVPFLVSQKARTALEAYNVTGIEFAPVHIAKIATKGKRRKPVKSGEPEDRILKSRGVSLDLAPTLFAVYVVGRVGATPDYPSGRHPANLVSPFGFEESAVLPDLWRPQHLGKPFSAWVFCSSRFKSICEQEKLSNITFVPFDAFMGAFRRAANKRLEGPSASGHA